MRKILPHALASSTEQTPPTDSLNRALYVLRQGVVTGLTCAIATGGATYALIRAAESQRWIAASRSTRLGTPLGIGLVAACYAVKHGVANAVRTIDSSQRELQAPSSFTPSVDVVSQCPSGPADFALHAPQASLLGFVDAVQPSSSPSIASGSASR